MNRLHHDQYSSRRYTEKSIPIEYSEEDDDYVVENYNEFEYNQSEGERHSDIKKLKKQSISRLHNKWNDILERYSRIDDSKESDEIDIITGDIITDNGHLRSMGINQERNPNNRSLSNIWSVNFDWENDNLNAKRKESRLKKKKSELRAKLKEQDLFHVYKDTTKRVLEDPKNREVCNDNMLLLTPSPVKRARLEKENESKAPPPPKLFQNELNGLMPNLMRDLGSSSSNNVDLMTDSATELIDNEDSDPGSASDSLSERSSSFDDEYSIVSSPLQPKSKRSIYNCAFENCHYCTGNKSLYQSHLLEKHSVTLRELGYPVSLDGSATQNDTISLSSKRELLRDFPLVLEVPPIPDTFNGRPIVCGHKMSNGLECKKFFLDDLQDHKCSHKRQVLLCPLLGCGFMTDEGYLSWRNHFIEEGHCREYVSSKSMNAFNGQQTHDDGYDSIEELFSD
ncbi:hypothetical protein CLIB1423_21S01332 [[Candida] railenensis]|uniref:Uncharacterized protein n=1 Tax=[Candida] railenensis TaxID=45579 RepID=A0A9P0QU50_9ASCO|nr:hypothetical protein CLIB1423_21S01332 [[Candida] railenensis]